MALHHKVYRFRLRPTKAQEEKLYRFAGAKRYEANTDQAATVGKPHVDQWLMWSNKACRGGCR